MPINKCSPTPPTPPPPPPPPSNPAFHVVAFQWSVTFCKWTNCKELKGPAPAMFKLHGLWPSLADGTPFTKCLGAGSWSGSALKDIREDLKLYWPSYQEPENKFWEHQWTKHGRCSGLPLRNYFEQALKFARSNTKILKAFRDSAIISHAGSSYTIDAFNKAIIINLNLQPRIQCVAIRGGADNVKYLLEIRLCVNTTFHFQDCSTKNTWLYGCGGPGYVKQNKAKITSS